MTARRRTGGRQHRVLLTAGLALAVVVGLVLVHAAWLLVVGGLAAGACVIGRDRMRMRGALRIHRAGPAPVQPVIRPATSADADSRTAGPAGQLAAVTAERDQLAAETADLWRQLAAANDAAHAAWDAAANVTPRPTTQHDDAGGKRGTLLADPRSGARPLVGQ